MKQQPRIDKDWHREHHFSHHIVLCDGRVRNVVVVAFCYVEIVISLDQPVHYCEIRAGLAIDQYVAYSGVVRSHYEKQVSPRESVWICELSELVAGYANALIETSAHLPIFVEVLRLIYPLSAHCLEIVRPVIHRVGNHGYNRERRACNR